MAQVRLTLAELQAQYGMTQEQAKALLARMEERQFGTVKYAISNTTGSVCVYRLRRFPFTAKSEEWRALARVMPKILELCAQHDAGTAPKDLYFTPKKREEEQEA